MEDRVAEFQSQASARLPSPKLEREISSLRRFLHKNQEHKFTEREKQRLFTAVQAHFSNPAAAKPADGGDGESVPVVALIEDALKMPFTVFTTAHKQQMLKWLESLRDSATPKAASTDTTTSTAHAIDLLPDGTLCLIHEDGSSASDARVEPGTADFTGITAALGSGLSVLVETRGQTVLSWRAEAEE
jgi:hypothetical protein